MKMRVRGPNGVSTLNISETATVADLRAQISAATELPAFDLKSGYPPQALNLDQFANDLALADTGLKLDGEQVIAVKRDIAGPLEQAVAPPPPVESTSAPAPSTVASSAHPPPPQQPPPLARRPAAQRPSSPSTDPPEIPVPSIAATLVLRVMPDDNSCLFRAIASAVLGPAASHETVHELRSLVATRILSDPATYNSAVLDNRSPATYCAWIKTPDAWGGAIELGILAQQFDIEIASVNVQDGRVDRFNEGRPTRAILVYSGIHYDVVATSPSEPPHLTADVPAEFDTKVFGVGNDEVMEAALELCRQLRKRHYYTDTAGFSIKCGTCGWMGKGEKSARAHAKQTGHTNFGEA